MTKSELENLIDSLPDKLTFGTNTVLNEDAKTPEERRRELEKLSTEIDLWIKQHENI
jgi:hypothetical protein